MRNTVVVVSHTHWDREWYRPAEVFRLRLADKVAELVDVLDRDPSFGHFMLDGQTVCIDDVLAVRPSLRPRLAAHLASGRIGIGPWYVLQDEFLVGAEAIVRNLKEGLRAARAFGRPMPVGYLPDAFGHIAQMPRILRGFGIDTAVVWRGVGDRSPGSEWRWRSPDGAEVLCLFLPGGYGNAAKLGSDEGEALHRLRRDLAEVLPKSRAGVLLWMNGTDHLPVEPQLPSLLAALGRAVPEVDLMHASLERAAQLVRERVDVDALSVVEGELLRATADVPVLSGVWSTRSWQKREHDEAQTWLARFAEPFVALAGADRREALSHAWRLLLRCQPHDSICGCSIDEVHREIDTRLARVRQLGEALFGEAVRAILGAPTADFAVHEAIAIANPHPFVVDASVEVEVQRLRDDAPFRLVGPDGEVGFEILSRWPSESPDRRPTEWLRLRAVVSALPAHGLRVLALEAGTPTELTEHDSPLELRAVSGGLEIADRDLVLVHTFEDEDDRGDLYDFCPTDGPVRSSREVALGVHMTARAIGRRVELEVVVDNRRRDHRLRARFDLSTPPAVFSTETAFGWLERTTPGTHPVAAITTAPGFAVGGAGLHEVERGDDRAIFLTLLRAVGWMSHGDLSTRAGHAGYAVPTPEAQGQGPRRFRYVVAFGAEAAREVDAGMIAPVAIPLATGRPADRALLSVEPASVRLSMWKRADEGDEHIVRLCGPPQGTVTARLRTPWPLRAAWWSDLDERTGAPIAIDGEELALPIAAGQVVTLRLRY